MYPSMTLVALVAAAAAAPTLAAPHTTRRVDLNELSARNIVDLLARRHGVADDQAGLFARDLLKLVSRKNDLFVRDDGDPTHPPPPHQGPGDHDPNGPPSHDGPGSQGPPHDGPAAGSQGPPHPNHQDLGEQGPDDRDGPGAQDPPPHGPPHDSGPQDQRQSPNHQGGPIMWAPPPNGPPPTSGPQDQGNHQYNRRDVHQYSRAAHRHHPHHHRKPHGGHSALHQTPHGRKKHGRKGGHRHFNRDDPATAALLNLYVRSLLNALD
ncbi:hypothetical protein BC835DRAFT_1307410 [Cytidiella melzeri]|nr:hypothetical protein BC835DRAFT_1307410 [Cytidiella melzeri]